MAAWFPAPGYTWASDDPDDFTVVPTGEPTTPTNASPTPGTPHPDFPNVVWAEGGSLNPAPGYAWASDDPNDFSVVPTGELVIPTDTYPAPGTPHEELPNVVWGEDGIVEPAPGYDWASNDPNDFTVVPAGGSVTPTDTYPAPGTPSEEYPNVVWGEDGIVEPAPGYDWASNDPNDFAVVPAGGAVTPASTYPTPGTPHPDFPNVVWAQGGEYLPAPGYEWASGDPYDTTVVPVGGAGPAPSAYPTPGTPHDQYPNVVWGAGGNYEPAPGYDWASDDPNDFTVVSVQVANLPPGDRALLIGIDNYGDSNLNLVGDSVNDAVNVSRLLTDHMGYLPEQVRVLTNAAATRDAILGSVEDWLIGESLPGSRIVFYFSGHGYFQPDENGDEDDPFDEVLVPYNADILPRNTSPLSVDNLIFDDDLSALFSRVPDRRTMIVVDFVPLGHHDPLLRPAPGGPLLHALRSTCGTWAGPPVASVVRPWTRGSTTRASSRPTATWWPGRPSRRCNSPSSTRRRRSCRVSSPGASFAASPTAGPTSTATAASVTASCSTTCERSPIPTATGIRMYAPRA